MKQPISEEVVRTRAYAIWESEGRPEGRAAEHWNEARRQVEAGVTSEGNGEHARLQPDPAEGDLQRVERELARQPKSPRRRKDQRT